MKLYLITTIDGGGYLLSKGVMIIAAIDEESARNQFEMRRGKYKGEQIDTIEELSANSEGVLYRQDPIIG